MAELGKYTIPSDVSLAGAEDSKCKGNGTHGLQGDFEKAVKAFLKDDALKGISVVMGYSGYVSKSTNESWQSNGNSTFANDSEKLMFGWGLGWEINKVIKSKKSVSATTVFCGSEVKSALSAAGLEFRSTSGGLCYLRPSNVDYDASAKELSFDENYSSSGSDSDSDSSSTSSSLAAASYFFANQFNAVVDSFESNNLQGIRALANDEPLWNYVKKAVNASLRTCSSDPDGNFIAWYPDYFGKYGVTPSTEISLNELQDLTITQSDKEFYSHVFCPGVDITGTKIDMMWTQGVVAIETDDAAIADSAQALEEGKGGASNTVSSLLKKMIYIPDGDEWKYSPRELYRRYGARPAKTQSLPNFTGGVLIEDATQSQAAATAKNKKSSKKDDDKSGSDDTQPEYILPFLYALYEFMYHWANQYQAKIQVTFMPEVFPGSRIRVNLPSGKNIKFYVQTVTHNMSYTSGFTTQLGCICPVGNLVSGMVKG